MFWIKITNVLDLQYVYVSGDYSTGLYLCFLSKIANGLDLWEIPNDLDLLYMLIYRKSSNILLQ